jgi:putative PIN family toxin of toxin-antitoxin system
MIRAVFDTNVVVSALLQPLGPSAQLLLLALNGSIQLCITGSIYAEYEEVISRPRLQRSPEAVPILMTTSSWNALRPRRRIIW